MQIKIIPPTDPVDIEIRDVKRCHDGCRHMATSFFFSLFNSPTFCKEQKMKVDGFINDISAHGAGWCHCNLFDEKLRVGLKLGIDYNVTDLSIYRALACMASKVVHGVPEYEAALKLNDELTRQGLTKPRGNMLAGEK